MRAEVKVRPWMILAAALVAAVLVASRLVRRAVKGSCPFLVGRAFMADALARLASVRSGTEIDILDHSLRWISERSWEAQLLKWLRRGARVRYLVHVTDEEGEAVVRRLAAGAGSGEISLFVIKDKDDKDDKDEKRPSAGGQAGASDVVRDTEDFHFVVFRDPDQLWLEGVHTPGEASARDCEYVPRASDDERWGPRREDFRALVSRSREVNLERRPAQGADASSE